MALSVDFGFRFQLGYIVDCDIRQFGGVAGQLRTFLRVRPEGGREVLLGDYFFSRECRLKRTPTCAKVHAELQFSGYWATGEGVFLMHLLVFNNRERIYRRRWKVKAILRGKEENVNFSMLRHAVAPFARRSSRHEIVTAAAPISRFL